MSYDFFAVLQGFVISDMRGIDRITTPSRANYTYSVLEGVSAGIDMVSEISCTNLSGFDSEQVLELCFWISDYGSRYICRVH